MTQRAIPRLAGKTAVITGSTRGFGLAMARAFGQAGANVVVSSRSQAAVDQAAALLRAEGLEVRSLTCDVTDQKQVEALGRFAVEQFGQFDIWINNAGLPGIYGPTLAVDPRDFIAVLQTHIFGVYYGSIVAMRHFLMRRTGKLINILGAGERGDPLPMQNAYGPSKVWIRSFTTGLAKEYADSGIGIFAYSPGLIFTEMTQQIEVVEGYQERIGVFETVLRMWGNPPEVPAARAVQIGSSRTDGKTGLVIRQLGLPRILKGLLQEGVRRLLRQQAPPVALDIQTVQPAFKPATRQAAEGQA